MVMLDISGWGNWPSVKARVREVASVEETIAVNQQLDNYVARGAGRSYGDSAIARDVLSSEKLSKSLNFDEQTGVYVCQAGRLLFDVLNEIVPRGYFLPVTPGTKFVSVGGAIAADVHGKNHHIHGCFSNYLNWFTILLADGTILKCSKSENKDLFWATCGGMGLTGVILEASFNLLPIQSSKIVNRTVKCANLNEAISCLNENQNSTYSVAWVDAVSTGNQFGRALVHLGEHALSDKEPTSSLAQYQFNRPKFGVPFNLPNWFLNPLLGKVFNAAYYGKVKAKESTAIVDLDNYFYPLDRLNNWNRLYGKYGFVQYQVVIPTQNAEEGIQRILEMVSESKDKPFLVVLKVFGEENAGWLSFPKSGLQLAMDFKRTDSSLVLFDELDELVESFGGRFYLAKDARATRSFFESGYSRLEAFKTLLASIRGNGKFRSLQSDRLGITE